MYRKFGDYNKYIYAILGVTQQVVINETGEVGPVMATLEIEFVELTEDGAGVFEPEGEEEYSSDLSMVFDVFFVSLADSLETIGICACIAILATVWVYVVFYFDA